MSTQQICVECGMVRNINESNRTTQLIIPLLLAIAIFDRFVFPVDAARGKMLAAQLIYFWCHIIDSRAI